MVYPAVRIPAVKAPTATVIFLHGLGDSGNGWRFLADEAIRRKRLQHVSFVFPDAPEKEVTLNFGMKMPAWYDIRRLENVRSSQDEAGVLESISTLEEIIAEETSKGIPSQRVIIGGFSQGCAVSYGTLITSDVKLGGMVGLSGYLPIHEKLATLQKDTNTKVPVFLGHGTSDNVVKFEFGKTSYETLRDSFKFENVEWNQYPNLVHSVSPQELEDIFTFLEKTIPAVE